MGEGVKKIQDAFAQAEPIDAEASNQEGNPPPPPTDGGDADKFRESAGYDLSDLGNSRRFILHAGRDVFHVPRVGWHVWNGRFWEHDVDEIHVRKKVQQLPNWVLNEVALVELDEFSMRLLSQEETIGSQIRALESLGNSASEQDERDLSAAKDKLSILKRIKKRLSDRRSSHRKFAVTSGNSTRLKNALSEASVQNSVKYEELDDKEFMVNAANAVLDFQRDKLTGAMVDVLPQIRERKITKELDVTYDASAKCPQFHKFIERILPDKEIRRFLQRWFGLSMTAYTGEQRMVFLYGAGANGKSVLVDLMAKLMGSYAATARIESLTGSTRRGGGDATPDLIPLMGARMVRTSEPDEGQRLQEGLIKEMTGGEPMMVRALHSDFVEIKPVFKLTMSGNHKPEIRGTDDGIWRRLLLVPFTVQIPEKDRDRELDKKLWNERSGVLNWLIEGLTDYMNDGLQVPAAVSAATEEYREESDPIMTYLLECCEITGEAADELKSKELAEGFNLYRQSRSLGTWKDNTISKRIKEKSERWQHPETAKSFKFVKASISKYQGIRFTSEFSRLFNLAERDSRGNLVIREDF